MKVHRFISTFQQSADHTSISDPETVFQITNVLKLKPGEEIILTDGHGTETHAQLVVVQKRQVEIAVLESKQTQDTRSPLHAYISILKKDNLELAVQKITELGITDITPITSDRTIKKNYSAERLEKIMKEAIEQSGQSILPRLHTELSLGEAITEAKKNSDRVVFFDEPNTDKVMDLKYSSVSFFVGPEGGWSPKEIELFHKENLTALSLGNTTLRGETAAIVGTFYLQRLQK